MKYIPRASAALLCAAVLAAPFITSAASCPSLTRSLARNATGEDVRALQVFLADRGLLERIYVIGVYGLKTEKAVQAFQREQGIVSSGSPAANGYGAVGTRTRLRIAAVCAAGVRSNVSTPSNSTYQQQTPMLNYPVPVPLRQNRVITPAPETLRLEIGAVTLDSVKVLFYAMPPQTHIVLIDPVTGKRVEAGGFSPLATGGNGNVTFPMLGEFAGRTFAFQAQSSSTAQKIAASSVFTVPRPPATAIDQIGTFVLLDGEVPLFTFPGITLTNAESRCKTEKTNNPGRNTRCTFNGASILY
ncbi:MAG: peptidoglycan-binding protein [Candidatus Pacebacteria bacterium]|nr:peptidoglycan-binding protein [Candidatus Paceibacterota bacterium]